MWLVAWSVYQTMPSAPTAGSCGKAPGRGIRYSVTDGDDGSAAASPARAAATSAAKRLGEDMARLDVGVLRRISRPLTAAGKRPESARAGLGPLRHHRQERLERPVRPPAAAADHLLERLVRRKRRLVGTGAGERVVDVPDPHDLRRHRDLLAPQAIGIPRAVELLVMGADD